MEHQLLMLVGVAEQYIVLVDLDHLGEQVVEDLVDMGLMEQTLDNIQEPMELLTLEEVAVDLKDINQVVILEVMVELLEAPAALVSSSLPTQLHNN